MEFEADLEQALGTIEDPDAALVDLRIEVVVRITEAHAGPIISDSIISDAAVSRCA